MISLSRIQLKLLFNKAITYRQTDGKLSILEHHFFFFHFDPHEEQYSEVLERCLRTPCTVYIASTKVLWLL